MKANKLPAPYNIALDNDESEIENSIDFEKAERVDNAKERIAIFKAAATNHLRKDKQINIRITSNDLLRLKEAAADEGMPYQTLIASILHKYALGHRVQRT